jgi:hypothetical protein
MSFRGELLSVMGEVVVSDDDAPKFALLWTSRESVDETGEELPKKRSRLTGETPSVVEKHPSAAEKQISSSLQKSLMISEPANEIPLRRLNPTSSHIAFISLSLMVSLCFLSIYYFRLYIFRSF